MALDGRVLLHDWLTVYTDRFSLRLLRKGDPFDKQQLLHRVADVTSKIPDESVIYVLSIVKGEELVPVYVGKTKTPLKRWEGHINGLLRGGGRYSKWLQVLFQNWKARFDTSLILIPASKISEPPIPNFPITVGSVEYQLVELVSGNYPETCLNVEGKRR
jgi:hypothetical protein